MRRIAYPALIALLAALLLAGVVLAQSNEFQQLIARTLLVRQSTRLQGLLNVTGNANFASSVSVDGNAFVSDTLTAGELVASGNQTVTGDLAVEGGAVVSESLAVTGPVAFAGPFALIPQPPLTVTAGYVLTPTAGALYPLIATDTATITLGSVGSGALLAVLNISTGTVIITGTQPISGEVLGLYGNRLFVRYGDVWVQVGGVGNE